MGQRSGASQPGCRAGRWTSAEVHDEDGELGDAAAPQRGSGEWAASPDAHSSRLCGPHAAQAPGIRKTQPHVCANSRRRQRLSGRATLLAPAVGMGERWQSSRQQPRLTGGIADFEWSASAFGPWVASRATGGGPLPKADQTRRPTRHRMPV
jgi:hypothetical protein